MNRNKNRVIALTLIAVAYIFGVSAFASEDPQPLHPPFRYETVHLPGTPFGLEPGDLYSLYLDGKAHFIRTIWVKAETDGEDAEVEVSVNGRVAGTLRILPETQPPAMINVRDEASSIEFRHLSGAYVHVLQITAVRSTAGHEDMDAAVRSFEASRNPLTASNTASELALQAIDLVEKLRPYVDPRTDYIDYLLPIKTSAGSAYSVAQAFGDNLSMQTRQAMKDLSFSIGQAGRILEDLMHIEAVFEYSVQMRALKHEIDRRLI